MSFGFRAFGLHVPVDTRVCAFPYVTSVWTLIPGTAWRQKCSVLLPGTRRGPRPTRDTRAAQRQWGDCSPADSPSPGPRSEPREGHGVGVPPSSLPPLLRRPRTRLDFSLWDPSPPEGRLGSPGLFLFAAESFIVSPWSWPGRGTGWLRGCPVAAGRGPGSSQTPGGAGGPSKASELHRLLVALKGEPFEDTPAQPSRGPTTPGSGAGRRPSSW